MNFTGRYWTRNRTLVDVREVETRVDGQEWVRWKATPITRHTKYGPSTDVWVCTHGTSYPDICKECKDSPTLFYYDEKGLCLLAFGEVGDNGRWDLIKRENPQHASD